MNLNPPFLGHREYLASPRAWPTKREVERFARACFGDLRLQLSDRRRQGDPMTACTGNHFLVLRRSELNDPSQTPTRPLTQAEIRRSRRGARDARPSIDTHSGLAWMSSISENYETESKRLISRIESYREKYGVGSIPEKPTGDEQDWTQSEWEEWLHRLRRRVECLR